MTIAKHILFLTLSLLAVSAAAQTDLYKRYASRQDIRVASVTNFTLDTGITNPAVHEEFTGCNVYSHEECGDCFARLYCSGGCAANAFHSTGSVSGVYELGCKIHRKRIECAIMLKVDEMNKA